MCARAHDAAGNDSVVLDTTEDDGTLGEQFEQEDVPRSIRLAPGLLTEVKTVGIRDLDPVRGAPHSLPKWAGDAIHWASNSTLKPTAVRSREAKPSSIVQPDKASMAESRSGTHGDGISVTASGNSAGVRVELVHASGENTP
jgi:hypothetical protein